MKNNKGMSFVELIIVMAVLAIMAVTTIGFMNYIHYGNTKKCAKELNAMIDKVRLQAMSKAEKPYLYLYEFGGVYYIKVGNGTLSESELDASGSKIANSQVQLSFGTMNPSVTPVTTTESQISSSPTPKVYMKLGFDKGTGGISKNSVGTYYTAIFIRDRNGNLKFTIRLVRATGKNYIEE